MDLPILILQIKNDSLLEDLPEILVTVCVTFFFPSQESLIWSTKMYSGQVRSLYFFKNINIHMLNFVPYFNIKGHRWRQVHRWLDK